MNRSEKQELIENLHAEFGQSPHAFLVDFKGLTVPAVTEFRRRVRKAGSRYRVVKNLLAQRASQGTAYEKISAQFDGTTGVAYTSSDPVALAKVLIDFTRENPKLVVKAGLVSGTQVLNPEEVKALSSMPALPELQARVLGLMQAPASQLVRVLNAPAVQLLRVLKAFQGKLAQGDQKRA